MWSELAIWAKKHTIDVEPPMADPADLSIPECVATCEEAIALLRKAYQNGKTVMRKNHNF